MSWTVPETDAQSRSIKPEALSGFMTDATSKKSPPDMPSTNIEIAIVCDEIKDLLLQKNKKYGDSALSPTRIFSQSSALEQLLVRIDDKLSRISRGAGLIQSDEDVILDLIGYLVLLRICIRREESVKIEDGYVGENPWKLFDSAYDWGERCPD